MFFNLCITTTGSHSVCGKEHFPIITPSLPQAGVHIWEGKHSGAADVRTMASRPPGSDRSGLAAPRHLRRQNKTSSRGKSRCKARLLAWKKKTQNTALILNLEVKKGLGRGDVDF